MPESLPAPGPPARSDTVAGQPEIIKQLRRQLLLKQYELDTVLSVARDVTARDHTEDELYRILTLTLQGQRSMEHVLLFACEENNCQVRLALGIPLAEAAALQLPPAIITHQANSSQPLELASLNLGPEWSAYELVIPVLRQQQPVAYVFVGGINPAYNQEQLVSFLGSLANTLMGAIENRRLNQQRVADAAMRKEIEIAQEVQKMLFPTRLPDDADLAVFKTYVPHAEIGGDYYDVVAVDQHCLLLCVADVSGKGVPASLLMSNFQAGLRTLLRQGTDLATIVPELNHLIYRNSGGEKFITAFLGLYDRRTRLLHYVNAGHNDPILLSAQGAPQFLKEGTVMLGIIEDLPMLQVGQITIPPHSLLLIYTDGLTEVFNAENEEYGEEGVLQLMQKNLEVPLYQLHEQLLEEIKDFNGGSDKFADDVTVLSCRFK